MLESFCCEVRKHFLTAPNKEIFLFISSFIFYIRHSYQFHLKHFILIAQSSLNIPNLLYSDNKRSREQRYLAFCMKAVVIFSVCEGIGVYTMYWWLELKSWWRQCKIQKRSNQISQFLACAHIGSFLTLLEISLSCPNLPTPDYNM